MTDFNPEVPAYVQHLDRATQGIRVKGGTNWDLSRSAIATPISTLPDPEPLRPAAPVALFNSEILRGTPYEPRHKMPSSAPATKVTFGLNSVILPANAQKALKTLPKNVSVLVAGHADPGEKAPAQLAKKRAEVVAAYLSKQGKHVDSVRYFGAELPLTESPFKHDMNRRVEVFVPE